MYYRAFMRFRAVHTLLVSIAVLVLVLGGIFFYGRPSSAQPTLSIVGGTGLELPFQPTDMVIQGSYAYIVFPQESDSGFRIVNISNPATPLVVGGDTVFMPSNGEIGSAGSHIAVQGNYAYITSEVNGNTKLFAVDISNPASPSISSQILSMNGSSMALTVSGNRAYHLDGNGDMTVVDISNPTGSLSVVGNTVTGMPNGRSLSAVVVSGNYAYIAGTDDTASPSRKKLFVVPLDGELGPYVIGSVDLGATSDSTLSPALTMHGKYAYITYGDTGAGSLKIVSVADPINPTDVTDAVLSTGTPGVSGLAYIGGDFAYIGRYDFEGLVPSSIAALDFSDPIHPVTLGVSVNLSAMPLRKIIQSGAYLYVIQADFADSFGGFRVIGTNVSSTQTAGVPFFTGGLPVRESTGVGVSDEVAVNSSESLDGSTVTTGTVTLKACTGAVDPTSCASPADPNVCTTVTVSGTRIICAHGDLTSGTVYQFRVANTIKSGSGDMPSSAYESIFLVGAGGGSNGSRRSLDLIPPDPITEFAATTDGKVATLAWKNPTAPDTRIIELLRNGGGNTPVNGSEPISVFFAKDNKSQFIDTDVKKGEEYLYIMRARDESGNYSVLTPEVSVRITPTLQPPAVVIPVENTPSVVVAPWNHDIFVKVGTPATKTLSEADREIMWRDYMAIYGNEPSAQMISLMGSGTVPMHALAWERAEADSVLPVWQKITGKVDPNTIVGPERYMYEIIMYRLQFARSLDREEGALQWFVSIFGRLPTTDLDWRVIHAMAYAK